MAETAQSLVEGMDISTLQDQGLSQIKTCLLLFLTECRGLQTGQSEKRCFLVAVLDFEVRPILNQVPSKA
jgi:hypothetical protein